MFRTLPRKFHVVQVASIVVRGTSLALSFPPYQAYGQRWRALAQGVGVSGGESWFGDVGGSGGEEAEG